MFIYPMLFLLQVPYCLNGGVPHGLGQRCACQQGFYGNVCQLAIRTLLGGSYKYQRCLVHILLNFVFDSSKLLEYIMYYFISTYVNSSNARTRYEVEKNMIPLDSFLFSYLNLRNRFYLYTVVKYQYKNSRCNTTPSTRSRLFQPEDLQTSS